MINYIYPRVRNLKMKIIILNGPMGVGNKIRYPHLRCCYPHRSLAE